MAPRELSGTLQNDVLKEYIARGTYIYPPKASLRIITDVFAYCAREVPQWNTISISGYHIREAGSTAVQEIAFTFANAIAYVEAARAAGLDVDAFGQRISFFFNAHNDFLEEVAKFRAARRLWARLMRDRFGARNPRAQQLRFHTQTAGSTLTARQPDNNIVRVALQALSAVLGGTQSLHTNGRDEALALPTEESARIALRTQQIIAAETGVTNTVDPFAGAYYVEQLTNDLERGAEALLERIDALGGTLAAIESGYIQRQIQDSAYRAQVAVDAGDAVLVGVNRYTSDEAERIEVFTLDPALEQAQVARVRALRARRDGSRWRAGDWTRWRRPPDRATISCLRSWPRSKRLRPSARSRTRCARCSASTAKWRWIDTGGTATCTGMNETLLSVENLTTVFEVRPRPVVAVDDVSFEIRRGETLGLVGESGSGKSVTAFSLVQLLQPPGRIAAGRIVFQGRDLLTLPEREMRKVRGAGIGLIFQEPMAALNPVMRVGVQIAEGLRVHGLAGKRDARARAIDLLRAVRIADPDKRVDDYPHQLSGGMRQRVMIAVALACRPPLIVADEPTTALDVTVQAQILELLRDMKEQFDLSLLLITHDLGVIAETADRVAVMYAGRIVESGAVREIFRRPLHPYTQGLLASIPGVAGHGRLQAIEGVVPNMAALPPGCTFAPRCPHRMDRCTTAVPALVPGDAGHAVRCYLHSDTAEPRSGPALGSARLGPPRASDVA